MAAVKDGVDPIDVAAEDADLRAKVEAADICAKIDAWPENLDFGLHRMCRALRQQLADADALIRDLQRERDIARDLWGALNQIGEDVPDQHALRSQPHHPHIV